MNRHGWILWLAALLALPLLTACEKENAITSGDSDVDGDTDGDGDSDSGPADSDSFTPVDTSGTAPEGCGDGELDEDEACDDANTESGDGCSGNCLYVAEGYSCNPPGQPCRRMAICGDGQVNLPELCDDGDVADGDGCSDHCQVEVGWKCSGAPSTCEATLCGDDIIEGAEGCDDGNALPFDGCSVLCQIEPSCTSEGCTSGCGDGLVLGEACDDGNNLDGDGCSASCETEEGYECIQPPVEGLLEVPVVYKDFTSAHPDFEPGALGCTGPTLGMVQDTLGADGKPVFKSSQPSCGLLTALGDWYDFAADPAAVKVSTMKLYENAAGDYVNMWGDDGTSWQGVANESWCDGTTCANCSCADTCLEPCTWGASACCASFNLFDGDPFFFPMDDFNTGAETAIARICEPYAIGCMTEEAATTAANLTTPAGYSYNHNFHFTSEVRFWFQYNEDTSQVLNFTGDDDVWVFINNQLELDLGGIHTPQEGSVDVNSLGLEDGQVYEIVVFQAERQEDGSSYRLTLSGFSTARSECSPDCGDGFVGLGEQCDDGENDGGYGECADGCVLGEYCGDGIVQEEHEHCDDGNFSDGDECPASCRQVIIE